MILDLFFRMLQAHGQEIKGKTAEDLYGPIPAASLICPECMSSSISAQDAMDERAVGQCLNCGFTAHFSQFQGVYLGECAVCATPAAAYCAGCRIPVCIDCIMDGYPQRPLCYNCF